MSKKPNSPGEGREDAEKKKGESGIAQARMLMRQYVEGGFKNPSIRTSLLKVLKAKNKEDIKNFYTLLTSFLSLSTSGDAGEFSDLTAEDLEKLTLIEIQNTIIRASVEFENSKRVIKNRIFAEYSGFTPEQQGKLDELLNDSGSFTIKRLVAARKDRTYFVGKHFQGVIPADIDKIAQDLAIPHPTDEQIAIFEKWNKTRWSISEKDISKLLAGLDGGTIAQKRNIIQYFLPTVSIAFLTEHNIITKVQAESIVTEAIKKLDFEGENISDDDIADIKNIALDTWIQGEKALSIDTSDLSDAQIEAWWNNKTAKREISASIEGDLVIDSKKTEESLNLKADADGKNHKDFLDHMDEELRNKRTGESKVENIHEMVAGSVIAFINPQTQKEDYYRVVGTDIENEDGHEGMILQVMAGDGKLVKESTSTSQWFNYLDIKGMMLEALKKGYDIKILSSDGWDNTKEGKNLVLPVEDRDTIEDKKTLISYMDQVDPDGRDIGLNDGITISYTDTATDEVHYATIKEVHEGSKEIIIKDGKDEFILSFAGFMDIFSSHLLKRVPPINNIDDFIAVAGIPGIINDHGKLKMEGAGGHHDDAHGGHDAHGKHVDIQAFTTADGKGHILVKQHDDGKITIQEYRGKKKYKEMIDEDPENPANKSIKKFDDKKAIYWTHEGLTYREFAEFIKNKKLTKITATNPLVDNDNYTTEAPFHEHRGFLKGLLNIGNIGELMEAFKMGWHAFEHTMEKGHKINAAKFMYRALGKMDNDVGSQVVADYVEAVGETIEKIRKKINGFNNGLKKRNKCLHLLEDKSSKPEEIAAALLVTVESSGGLYMDEPFVFYSGSWMWFNALVRAAGYDDPAAIKADIADKVKEVNAENPTEEMYIEQFLKKYGEIKQNPLLMAMGGYPKFRKTLIEGRKSETEKGERDAKELLGIDDRVQLGMNKMATGEYNQVIGIYKAATSKYAGGNADVLPWMWALSGATKIVHPNIANEFKNFTDGGGHTFHAISFCRNPEVSDLYKRVVGKVVHAKLPEKAAKEFDAIQEKVAHQFQHHHHRKEKELEEYNKDIMLRLQQFWKTHGKALHPILQGVDSYILENADDPDFTKYISLLNETHDYRGSAGNKGFDTDYAGVDGYKQNPSFSYEKTPSGLTVRTIKREFDWISIHSHNGNMDNAHYNHIFKKSILKYLSEIHNISDPTQRRETFKANYQITLNFLRSYIGTIDNASRYSSILNQDYAKDLIKLGFDLSHSTVIGSINQGNTDDIVRAKDLQAAENSFNRFESRSAWSTAGEAADTRARLEQFMAKRPAGNENQFRQAA